MTRPLRILIVDDDAVDRMAVSRALKASGVGHVVEETDGCAAAMRLLSAARESYDALIFDYLLPDGDGLQLLKDVRARGVKAPVIVLTGKGDERIAVELMKSGASDYLPKSEATTERLSQSIRSALRVREAEDEAARAQEALRLQLDTTRAITDSLAEGLVAVDPQARFRFVNPAAERMLGWPQDELLDRDIHETLHAREDRVRPCRLVEALLSGTVSRVDDDLFVRKDGSTFHVSYASSPIVNDGRIAGAVIAFHDITARRRAEAELEQSRRQLGMNEKLSALGTLVSGVAHEVRTPLTYIANSVFLVRKRLEEAARSRPDLEDVVREVRTLTAQAQDGVDRIGALVRDLRPFTQGGGGPRSDVSLDVVVATAVDLFRATHRGQVDVEGELLATPPIRLDVGQVQRVVINLLNNAADAMREGGTARVWTRPVPGGAELVVSDTGTGIPPEVESRIFDPFFTTKAEGTGLGLSITRRIVEAHGGELRYETAPGRGTTFRVFLPTVASTEAGAPLAPASG